MLTSQTKPFSLVHLTKTLATYLRDQVGPRNEQTRNIIVNTRINFYFSEDHWNLYLDFITSVFRLVDTGSNGDVISVEKALAFIHEQQVKFPKNRGPFLAQIELQTRLVARSGKSNPELEEELVRQLVAYFEKFSSKIACGPDLKLYLPHLIKESMKKFFEETLKMINFCEESNNRPIDVSICHSYLINYWLKLHGLILNLVCSA